ncbi:hypothetical protein ACHAPT_007191 [Fusarium lateritium]
MWLIDTETLKLESVVNPETVAYAILSHTWEEEEVSFQEFQNLELAETRKGFGKIRKTCRLARRQGYRYAWVDTCCIDKSSSAELSEAINSMFRWYKGARRCYAYLSDYRQTTVDDSFGRCRWFTRGWTLQELIAPASITFYNQNWAPLGSKKDLSQTLSNITRIGQDVLLGRRDIRSIDVVFRMSWAAGRQTSRPEDIAYCLFGIFDVNLPMLYGEGTKAFLRLQEEICQRVADLTLFAWKSDTVDPGAKGRGIFAHSPDEFAYASSGTYMSLPYSGDVRVSNRGVVFDDMELSIVDGEGLFLPLNFFSQTPDSTYTYGGIFLEKTPEGYARIKDHQLFPARLGRKWLPPEQINVISWGSLSPRHAPSMIYISTSEDITIRNVCPRRRWDPYRKSFMSVGQGMVELSLNLGNRTYPLMALLYFPSGGGRTLRHDLVDTRWKDWRNAQDNMGKADLRSSMNTKVANHFHKRAQTASAADLAESTSMYHLDEISASFRLVAQKVEDGWQVTVFRSYDVLPRDWPYR